jgi:hypothetical protein
MNHAIVSDVMSKAKKKARVKELFRLIDEATENLPKWQAELDGLLFADGKPTKQRKGEARAKPKAKASADGGNVSGRGEIATALRAALRSMSGEFTTRELIAEARIPDAQVPSAAAAISRMKPKEIKHGTTPGKYRRA